LNCGATPLPSHYERTLVVYDMTAPIGEDGMGQVFRARDTQLDRDVTRRSVAHR
jgi:hypothetical protein